MEVREEGRHMCRATGIVTRQELEEKTPLAIYRAAMKAACFERGAHADGASIQLPGRTACVYPSAKVLAKAIKAVLAG